MKPYVLDTDILSLYDEGHAVVCNKVLLHPPQELAITIITADEYLSGWYTQVRQAKNRKNLALAYLELGETIRSLARWQILPFTEPAMDRYDQLKAMKIGVRAMDLRIAAVVLEHGGIMVTRNVRDFQRVPNLNVENWAI